MLIMNTKKLNQVSFSYVVDRAGLVHRIKHTQDMVRVAVNDRED